MKSQIQGHAQTQDFLTSNCYSHTWPSLLPAALCCLCLGIVPWRHGSFPLYLVQKLNSDASEAWFLIKRSLKLALGVLSNLGSHHAVILQVSAKGKTVPSVIMDEEIIEDFLLNKSYPSWNKSVSLLQSHFQCLFGYISCVPNLVFILVSQEKSSQGILTVSWAIISD